MVKMLRGTNQQSRISHTFTDKREGWVFMLNYMHLWNDSGIYHFSLSRKGVWGRKTGNKEVENKREQFLFVIWQIQESLTENKETDVIWGTANHCQLLTKHT